MKKISVLLILSFVPFVSNATKQKPEVQRMEISEYTGYQIAEDGTVNLIKDVGDCPCMTVASWALCGGSTVFSVVQKSLSMTNVAMHCGVAIGKEFLPGSNYKQD